MSVTVLLFASYADALGTSSLRLDLEDGSTVRQLLGRLRERAGAHALPPEPMVAVNERYARGELVLAAGDTVAIIPPVAGG
ncbi:MAG TPA: molybdopterin converting factor subunit 1 [Gemmatimonadaceae bacterium]|jgi:molybdopterin converting factor subunit 1